MMMRCDIPCQKIFWRLEILVNLLEALAASLSCPLWPHPPPGAQRPPDGGKEEKEGEMEEEKVEKEEEEEVEEKEEKVEELEEEEAQYIYYSPNSLLSIHKLCQR